jgi:hypothetical protein
MKWNFLYQITAAFRTPDYGATTPRSPFSLSPVLNWICWTTPRTKFLGTPLLGTHVRIILKPILKYCGDVFGNYVGQDRTSVRWGSQHHSRSVVRKEIAQFHLDWAYNLEVATRFSENLRIRVINGWAFLPQQSNYYILKNSVPRVKFQGLEVNKFPSEVPTQHNKSKNISRLRQKNDPHVKFFSWSRRSFLAPLCSETATKRSQQDCHSNVAGVRFMWRKKLSLRAKQANKLKI